MASKAYLLITISTLLLLLHTMDGRTVLEHRSQASKSKPKGEILVLHKEINIIIERKPKGNLDERKPRGQSGPSGQRPPPIKQPTPPQCEKCMDLPQGIPCSC
ncbi:hypothetical protein HPP92_015290 [Vanilla planifolia]|uniref:Uncharacterized protein n=1 Tax=Vanilla planifolia TaxID=51239 RepID=A0A835QT46_VANPL|nr:hypothetical protein HPP92_015822 [Vanilla planifolia]KAG0475604.1 hypothetical protein HPP92_015290 [Vanilla planifolia]